MQDPAGDVRLQSPSGEHNAPPEFAYVDLREISVSNESIHAIELGLAFQQLAQPMSTPGRSTAPREFEIRFSIGMNNFTVFSTPAGSGQPDKCGANLRRDTTINGSTGSAFYCLETRHDPAHNLIKIIMPRKHLLRDRAAPFGAGDQLTGLRAASFARILPLSSVPVYATDRAPDTGVGPAYESVLGNASSTGDLHLRSPEPIRASNGEANTVAFALSLTNQGQKETRVLLSSDSLEADWHVRVPGRLILPPRSEKTFPVVLTMPFSHRHGDVRFFTVNATDADNPQSWATINLGLYWLDTPQPAGHHDTLYFHSGGPFSRTTYSGQVPVRCETRVAWMNAVAEDANDAQLDVPGCPETDVAGNGSVPYLNRHQLWWGFPLSPDLMIGLDFDLNRTAKFETRIRSPYAVNRAVLEVRLLYCEPLSDGESREAGESCPGRWHRFGIARSAPVSLVRDTPAGFSVEFPIVPEADLVPERQKSNLLLAATLTTDQPANAPNHGSAATGASLLTKDTSLNLPLNEYRNPIEQGLERVGSLRLSSEAPASRHLNPGRTALFHVELENAGEEPVEVRISLEGYNQDWARLTTPTASTLGSHSTQAVEVAVHAPDDAQPGERTEFFVVAESDQHAGLIALYKMRATIVDPTHEDIPDEASRAVDKAATPAGVTLALAAIALCLLARRRLVG